MSVTGQETKYLNNSDAINQDLGDRYVSKQYVADNYANILPDRLKGGLWGWGENRNGAFGDSTSIASQTPRYTSVYDDWLSFASGDLSVAAVKQDGTLWAWGSNNVGQLALGDTIHRSSPVQVGADIDWKIASINSSPWNSNILAAIKTNGTLWVAGFNGRGQLGLGDTLSRSTLTQVGSSTDWASVVACDRSARAIKTDGSLWVWGNNASGQLGLGDLVHRSSPVQVGTLTNWKTISLAEDTISLVLKTDGTIWSWGSNGSGTLGLGDLISRSSPVQIGADSDWKTTSHSTQILAIKTNGTLWVCGVGRLLGLGDTLSRSTLVQLGSGTDWKYVHANSEASSAIKTNGTLWVWGNNGNDRLGITPFQTSVSSPVQVTSYTSWRYSFMGFYNSIGFRVGGYF